MKKKFYIIVFIILLFPFKVNAEENYHNSFVVNNATSTLPNFGSGYDLWSSRITFTKSGVSTYSFLFNKDLNGVDQLSFSMGLTTNGTSSVLNEQYARCLSDGTNLDTCFVSTFGVLENDFSISVIAIGQNSKHMNCNGYLSGGSSITWICPLDFNENYYGLSIKFHYNINQENYNGQKQNLTLDLTIPYYMTIYYGAHTSVTDTIHNQTNTIQNGFDDLHNKTQDINDKLGDLNSNITNSDVETDGANSFFSGFDNNTHGLTSIVTSPLQFIGSITSSTCSPLSIPIPFVNQNAQLPCMNTIYKTYFGSFLTLYQTITFGLVSYWVCINIFATVKGMKDPDSDRIEVLDL